MEIISNPIVFILSLICAAEYLQNLPFATLHSLTMASKRLQVAVAGLGRMGARHALNILNKTPRAELIAAFSPDPKEISWGKQHLEPFGVTLYDDYDKMLTHTGLNAVVIGTATSVHAEEAIKAMDKDLHVLCEKPLSTSVKVVRKLLLLRLALHLV